MPSVESSQSPPSGASWALEAAQPRTEPGWRLQRLRAMGGAEIAARALRQARHAEDDLRWRFRRSAWARRWSPRPEHLHPAESARFAHGFLNKDRGVLLARRAPEAAERLLAEAESLVAGRFSFFGLPPVVVELPDGYARDPFSGSVWPDCHGTRLDYRDPRLGDPKWVWELNRCHDVLLLAAASLLVEDTGLARAARERFLGWTTSHAPGRGIAFANGFEPAMRVISLALAYDALRPLAARDPVFRERALLAIWQHGRWIARTPSTHSSANNHRLAELTALVVIGLLAPELADAGRWLSDSLHGLEQEASKQILADGTGAERSFAYHLVVVDLLLVVVALMRMRGLEDSTPLMSALQRAADGITTETDLGEPDPRYGDSDDSTVLGLDRSEQRGAREVAASLAALLGHPGARRLAGELDATAWWLFGEEGAARFAGTAAGSRRGSAYLPDGGRVIFRGANLRTTVDVGPLGYLSLAAHGHADSLQVDIADDEGELVIDPGVGSYFRAPNARSAFRGTALHATVAVDELDQSVSGGPFLWVQHAHAHVLHVDLLRGIVVAEHDGYQRLDDPVTHRRAVICGNGFVLVYDRLDGAAVHRYTQTWPFHPALTLRRIGARNVAARDATGRARLFVAFAAAPPAELTVYRGSMEPLAGWYSERLEDIQPAASCRSEVSAAGPVHLVTGFWTGQPAEAETTLSLGLLGSEVSIDVGKNARFRVDLSDRDRPLVEVVPEA